MNTKSVKSVSPNNKFLKKFLAVVLSIMVFIVSFIIITNSNNAAKDTIDVVRVKNKDGLTADTAISEDDLEVYKVIRREYKEDMYRGDELEQLVGKYPNYYLRTETIIHKDQLTDEKLQKNEWLYAMENDREAVTIPYDYIECGRLLRIAWTKEDRLWQTTLALYFQIIRDFIRYNHYFIQQMNNYLAYYAYIFNFVSANR